MKNKIFELYKPDSLASFLEFSKTNPKEKTVSEKNKVSEKKKVSSKVSKKESKKS